MNFPVKIQVTEQDIDMGVRSDCSWCPVARAIKRTLYGKVGQGLIPDGPVKVNQLRIEIDGGRIITPEKVADFIRDFDNEKGVSPFEFVLE